MNILAIDSSAVSAGAALLKDNKIVGESYINAQLTHSSTLMPMVASVLECTRTKAADIDFYAVSIGPGSFTGLRIGAATVKGMAFAQNTPCVAVSTLFAIACNYIGIADKSTVVCAVMDARCNQFYNGMFKGQSDSIKRLCDDRAVSYENLAKDITDNYSDKNIVLVGDGAALAYKLLLSDGVQNNITGSLTVAPAHLQYQRATGVAAAAVQMLAQDDSAAISAAQLIPSYLRLPQAERELKKKLAEKSM